MKILIYYEQETLVLAALEADKLTEYIRCSHDLTETTGEIRMGRITEVNPSLSGAFVEIGSRKNAFMPLDHKDLSLYSSGMELPVQIKRQEDEAKGIMVTDNFTISGRYVVLSHGNLTLGVSQKIQDPEERKRLKIVSKTLKEAGTVGYILRTESQGIDPFTLQKEASDLYEIYQMLLNRVPYSRTGAVLYSPGSHVIQFLSQYPRSSIGSIQIETSIPYEKRMDLINEIHLKLPYLDELITLREPSDGFSLAEVYKIPSAVSEALGIRVYLDHGGYLFIEETQALSVIDVNSSQAIKGNNKEEAVLRVNLEATEEIARQIRLRNLSGIIMIDYINMQKESSQKKVQEALKNACMTDPRKVTIHGFTKLGIMELSRETRGLKLREMV